MPAARVYPTERDRLRAVMTASHYTGDLKIDREFYRLAEQYVVLMVYAAGVYGYDLAWVQTDDDLRAAERDLEWLEERELRLQRLDG